MRSLPPRLVVSGSQKIFPALDSLMGASPTGIPIAPKAIRRL